MITPQAGDGHLAVEVTYPIQRRRRRVEGRRRVEAQALAHVDDGLQPRREGQDGRCA